MLGLSPAVWGATYYRWVDENGVPQYASTPPKGVAAEKVTTASPRPSVPAATSSTTSDVKPDAAASSQPAEQAQASLKDPQRCADARARVKVLETNTRIRMQQEDGGFYYLNASQIQEELAASRQAVKESC